MSCQGPGSWQAEGRSDRSGAAASVTFRLETLSGARLGPPDYAGQVVLLDFWATWCVPCRAQAATLEAVYDDYRDRGVQFLAIDQGEERDRVRRFTDERPFPYPVLLDPTEEVGRSFEVVALPHLVVIDRRGAVTYSEPGLASEELVRRLLDEADVRPEPPRPSPEREAQR